MGPPSVSVTVFWKWCGDSHLVDFTTTRRVTIKQRRPTPPLPNLSTKHSPHPAVLMHGCAALRITRNCVVGRVFSYGLVSNKKRVTTMNKLMRLNNRHEDSKGRVTSIFGL